MANKTKGKNLQRKFIDPKKIFPLKPGVKFSDVFMDGQQIQQEIYTTVRTLQHYRDSGKISYTWAYGKYLYLRAEIAELLEQNMVWRRNSKNS